jgi:hypothetical protein
MVGLSEIFQPDYTQAGALDPREHQTPNNNGVPELSAILDHDPLADLVNMGRLESNLPHHASQDSSLLGDSNVNHEMLDKGLGSQGARGGKPST